jgi:hypothetical protein
VLLGLVVSEVKRHVLKAVCQVLCLCDEGLDRLAEEALVLGLRVVGFAAELDDVGGGVVARTRELD